MDRRRSFSSEASSRNDRNANFDSSKSLRNLRPNFPRFHPSPRRFTWRTGNRKIHELNWGWQAFWCGVEPGTCFGTCRSVVIWFYMTYQYIYSIYIYLLIFTCICFFSVYMTCQEPRHAALSSGYFPQFMKHSIKNNWELWTCFWGWKL